MEHLREFGLSRDPFVNDPVLQFYYESPVHRGAERRLMRAIAQHKGLCLLLGDPGAGKSMLVRHLLEELEEEAYEASLLSLVQDDVTPSGSSLGWRCASAWRSRPRPRSRSWPSATTGWRRSAKKAAVR